MHAYTAAVATCCVQEASSAHRKRVLNKQSTYLQASADHTRNGVAAATSAAHHFDEGVPVFVVLCTRCKGVAVCCRCRGLCSCCFCCWRLCRRCCCYRCLFWHYTVCSIAMQHLADHAQTPLECCRQAAWSSRAAATVQHRPAALSHAPVRDGTTMQGSTATCAAAAQLPMRLQCKQGAHQTQSMPLCCMQYVALQLMRTIIMLRMFRYWIAGSRSCWRENARSREEVFSRKSQTTGEKP